jgi:protein-L-isoaspartate(D-aspartate) O-methyltransferase
MALRTFDDSYKHKGLRKGLVDSLIAKGIDNEQVIQAMRAVPRHFFIDPAFDLLAYEERAFPILSNQTMSQPFTVAFQTQLLSVKPFDKILEIGTGSGYQAAILGELGALVYTIERQQALFTALKESGNPLKTKYKQIKYFYGDGFAGLPTYAPFDKIIITCGAPDVPPKLIEQLKVGGVMVIPQNEGDQQRMKRLTKVAEGDIKEEQFGNFLFVPMLSGMNKSGDKL